MSEIPKEYKVLYNAVNEMMCVVVLDGQIDIRHDRIENVMDALYDIDGGVYKPQKTKIEY